MNYPELSKKVSESIDWLKTVQRHGELNDQAKGRLEAYENVKVWIGDDAK